MDDKHESQHKTASQPTELRTFLTAQRGPGAQNPTTSPRQSRGGAVGGRLSFGGQNVCDGKMASKSHAALGRKGNPKGTGVSYVRERS